MRGVLLGEVLSICLLVSVLSFQPTASIIANADEPEVWTDREAYRVGETVIISVHVWNELSGSADGTIWIRYLNETMTTLQTITFPEIPYDIFNFSWVQQGPPGDYRVDYQPDGCHCISFSFFFVYEHPGDVNFDGTVDILDILNMALVYNSRRGDADWNPIADIAPPYGVINILDIVTCAAHYGETYP